LAASWGVLPYVRAKVEEDPRRVWAKEGQLTLLEYALLGARGLLVAEPCAGEGYLGVIKLILDHGADPQVKSAFLGNSLRSDISRTSRLPLIKCAAEIARKAEDKEGGKRLLALFEGHTGLGAQMTRAKARAQYYFGVFKEGS
jgi:hypothetical protein